MAPNASSALTILEEQLRDRRVSSLITSFPARRCPGAASGRGGSRHRNLLLPLALCKTKADAGLRLGHEPVYAHTDIHHERDIKLRCRRHFPFDECAQRPLLLRRELEDQLVVHLQEHPRRQP